MVRISHGNAEFGLVMQRNWSEPMGIAMAENRQARGRCESQRKGKEEPCDGEKWRRFVTQRN